MTFDNLLISDSSKKLLKSYLKNSSLPLLIYGDKWTFKDQVAETIGSIVLNQTKLANHPFFLEIKASKSIALDQIRALQNFQSLKTPAMNQDIQRLIIIHHAEQMRIEAQNAILKNLEELSSDTLIILIANSLNPILKTIRSRTVNIAIIPCSKEQLREAMIQKYPNNTNIDQILKISAGLPKLAAKMLHDNQYYQQELQIARRIISSSRFERLTLIDELIKNKNKVKDILFIIRQMANQGLRTNNISTARKWLKILDFTILAEEDLGHNTQLKIFIMDYLLKFN